MQDYDSVVLQPSFPFHGILDACLHGQIKPILQQEGNLIVVNVWASFTSPWVLKTLIKSDIDTPDIDILHKPFICTNATTRLRNQQAAAWRNSFRTYISPMHCIEVFVWDSELTLNCFWSTQHMLNVEFLTRCQVGYDGMLCHIFTPSNRIMLTWAFIMSTVRVWGHLRAESMSQEYWMSFDLRGCNQTYALVQAKS